MGAGKEMKADTERQRQSETHVWRGGDTATVNVGSKVLSGTRVRKS